MREEVKGRRDKNYMKSIMKNMNERNTENIEKLCGVLIRSKEESANQPSKVIKAA